MPTIDLACVIFSKSWSEFAQENELITYNPSYLQSKIFKPQSQYLHYLERLLQSIKKHIVTPCTISINIVELDAHSLQQTLLNVRKIAETLALDIRIIILGYPLFQKYIEFLVATKKTHGHSVSGIHNIAIIQALSASQADYVVYLDSDISFTKPGLIEYSLEQLRQQPHKAMCAFLENKKISLDSNLFLPRAYSLFICLDKNRLNRIIDIRTLIDHRHVLFNSRNPLLKAIAENASGERLCFDSLCGLTMYLTYEITHNAIIDLTIDIPLIRNHPYETLELSCAYFTHTRALT
jgi:hypothetical protein